MQILHKKSSLSLSLDTLQQPLFVFPKGASTENFILYKVKLVRQTQIQKLALKYVKYAGN